MRDAENENFLTKMLSDIIMLKSLNVLEPNYAGAESQHFVAAGIINLEHEMGHLIADMCVKDLLENFNGNDWVS
jgi:lactosylceramide 4-alpha-galactosyltransferase